MIPGWLSSADLASGGLVVEFYRHPFGPQKLTAAAALHASQLEMWRNREFAAPYFWASFVLQGEWK